MCGCRSAKPHETASVRAHAVHELTGVGILLSMWLLCYKTAPTQRLLSLGLFQTISESPKIGTFKAAYDKGFSKWNARFSNLAKGSVFRKLDARRAAISMGESFVLRKGLAPVLVPAKIWLAVTAVFAFKRPVIGGIKEDL